MESTPVVRTRILLAELVANLAPQKSEKAQKSLFDRTIALATDIRPRNPDANDISERCHGIAEKYSVLARDDLADALEERLQFLLPPESDQVLSTLALLLNLARTSALKNPVPDEIANPERLQVRNHAVDWARIIDEEPLEGDHWLDYEPGQSDVSSEENFEPDE
ncbi:hypothetical protein V1514DRAFT_344487 [Lipomyces japonicus]|uniref:uncharacterized protein n=1 Tax=Lipomyces japonicus TaxID=56871 RepID=UPI0034CEFCD5